MRNTEYCSVRLGKTLDKIVISNWLLKSDEAKWLPPSDDNEKVFFASTLLESIRNNMCAVYLYKEKIIGCVVLFPLLYKKVSHITQMNVICLSDQPDEDLFKKLIENGELLARSCPTVRSINVEVYEGDPKEKSFVSMGFVHLYSHPKAVVVDDERRDIHIYEKRLENAN